ncbi:ethanolamine ammonia-lyase [Pseudomonas syringae ICMP 11168]|nr:ethanolamine ammonia-lyase [Pseudomonas syringae ICMP 11168]
MMGQLSSGQERLFYSFNLEDHIPIDHLLRSIDQCLDLSDLRLYLAYFYSPIGRSSIDPELQRVCSYRIDRNNILAPFR